MKLSRLDDTLDKDWRDILEIQFKAPYMKSLETFLEQEKKAGKILFPSDNQVFRAFTETAFRDVQVVIIGQDPYHGEGQAMGLSFSVPEGVRLPPSLINIFKEIETEFAVRMPKKGDLTSWARQGVLLLNATLTVESAKAGAHQKKGWETLTDYLIREISDRRDHVVFLLWGSYAQKKGAVIDRKRHLVLESAHPSPLSAHRGFLGNNHFRLANDYLKAHGLKPIEWWKL